LPTLWLLLVCLAYNTLAAERASEGDSFRFGVIADCQYCNVEGTGVRKYSLSPDKLRKCVDHFNTMDLEFVVHLGDFIDRDFDSFDVVGPIFNELKAPKHHVLGNHDFEVADERKEDVPEKMGLQSRYYDFTVKNWRFVVLDGNDISFHAYPKGSGQYREAEQYYETNQLTSPKWNGAVGSEQIAWLEGVLEQATTANENVILFSHFPVYPDNVHNLWNTQEIIELIEHFPCVKAYMNGHNHAGNYGSLDGVHYLTFKGMVDTEETSYATVEVGADSLEVSGFGRETDRTLGYHNTGPKSR